MNSSKFNISLYIRALRLPFITASVIPFIAGSFIGKNHLQLSTFFLGLAAAVFTHLGANLINDYADSQSGTDWQDRRFYGFFGGSKLIQEGKLSEKFYFAFSIVCFVVAFLSVIAVTILIQEISTIWCYLFIFFLVFSYSHKPLAFSYRRLGELIIFLLFGPVIVMGAYFIQTKIFPTLEGFLISLPFGLLTTAILFSNEAPDFFDDEKAGKFTWVGITKKENAFVLYALLIALAFISIAINIVMGYLGLISLLSFIFIIPSVKATQILKRCYHDKIRLTESSKLTIAIQGLVGIILILGILL